MGDGELLRHSQTMNESQDVKIDFSEMTDIVVESKECACRVIFLKCSDYKQAQIDACAEHNKEGCLVQRLQIIEKAKVKRNSFVDWLEQQLN